MRRLCALWDATRQEDQGTLRDLATIGADEWGHNLVTYAAPRAGHARPTQQSSNDFSSTITSTMGDSPTDLVTGAMTVIVGFITSRTSHFGRPGLSYDASTRRATIKLSALHLLGVMWLQFAEAVAGNFDYRTCLNCGTWWLLNPERGARTNRRYCDNACRVAFHRMRPQRARELAATGLSVAEIAVEIDSRPETVKQWLR